MIFTELFIKSDRKTNNPKFRELLIGSNNPDEEKYIQSNGSFYIGKILNITSDNESIVNINNFFPELSINLFLKDTNCESVLGVIPYHNNLMLVFKNRDFLLNRTDIFNEKNKLYKNETIDIVKQLVSGIKYLHSMRILHGNIHPKNIIVDHNNEEDEGIGDKFQIKISDYKYASLIIDDDRSIFEDKVFTKNYRAPEVWESKVWGFSADIWALGCTIYYLVYKQELFPKQESNEGYIGNLNAWKNRKINELGIQTEISKHWIKPENFIINNLILRMCNPNESKRPSIFEVYSELNKIETYTIPISKSPDSVCRYIDIQNCENIISCNYDYNSFISPSKSSIIEQVLNNTKNEASLIMCVYETISTNPTYDKDTFNLSKLISYFLIRKKCDINITNKLILRVKSMISHNKINFMNWEKFYRIH